MLKLMCGVTVGLICTSSASAQNPVPPTIGDSTVAQILATEDWRAIGRVLRPFGRPQSQAKLNALADSVVSRAVEAGRANREAYGVDYVFALSLAGRRPSPDMEGIAYGGATERLIRIHREAPRGATVVRSAALHALPDVIGFERGMNYLLEVATSDDPTAGAAATALIEAATPGASALSESERLQTKVKLKDLWSRVARSLGTEPPLAGETARLPREIVPNPEAFMAFRNLARREGWAKRSN